MAQLLLAAFLISETTVLPENNIHVVAQYIGEGESMLFENEIYYR